MHPINLQDTSNGVLACTNVFTSRMENIKDPDQLAFEKPADLDLHCFKNRYIKV